MLFGVGAVAGGGDDSAAGGELGVAVAPAGGGWFGGVVRGIGLGLTAFGVWASEWVDDRSARPA